jgi:polygalacturonase
VNGKNLTNVVISGRGTIDGAGARWWVPVRAAKLTGQPETVRRPRLVVLTGCKNVRVENVTLQNSPSFHLVPADCEDVVITNVTIQAPADSPNTDAIDPSCRNLLITHCRLDVGDDNVAIKAGHKVAGREFQDENITVTDCTFLRGHGMSIGSETRGGVKNLLVKNCTFDGTTSGIRIKTSRERGGTVEGLVYRDLTMTNVEVPINITCYYPKIPASDSAQPITADTPVYRDIQIINLTASGPRSAGFVVGLPEMCVSNVVFENVKLSAETGLTIRNAKGIRFKNSSVAVKQGAPFSAENADVEGLGKQGE